MSGAIAKRVAIAIAAVLISSGVLQLFASSLRHPFFGIALISAGTAILFGRSWGYYVAYIAAFSSLLPPQMNRMVYVPDIVRLGLWLHVGMGPVATNLLCTFVLTGVLAWAHLSLLQSGLLDRPMSPSRYSQTLRAARFGSYGMIIIPVLTFIYQWALNPPSSGVPASFGGGYKAFLVLYLGWPFVLTGIIGVIVFSKLLKRHSAVKDAFRPVGERREVAED